MLNVISDILEKKLASGWSSTPIAWPNMVYIPQQDVPFIRPNITQTTSQRINAGDVGYYRDFGLMTVQVFTSRRKGARENANLASAIVTLFREYNYGGLFCGTPHIEVVGETKEWYQSNVIVDYYYDSCQP